MCRALSLSVLHSVRCLQGITFETEWLHMDSQRNLFLSPKSHISLYPSNLKLWTLHCRTRVNWSGLQKNSWITCGFAWAFFQSGNATDPIKSLKDSTNLVVCTQKKFLVEGAVFCEWRCKWMTYTPPWPTSPGPGPKPLDGSISLKFSLETRLLSESFDTSNDLLGFQVEKLPPKVIKISD